MNYKQTPELVTRAARIIRQLIIKHVDPYDPAVMNAVFILFDWQSARYQYDGVKEKTQRRFVELQCAWNNSVNSYT